MRFLIICALVLLAGTAKAMTVYVHVQDSGTTDPIEAAYVRYIFNPGTAAEDTVDGYTDASGDLTLFHDLVSAVTVIPSLTISRSYPNPAGSTVQFDIQSPEKASQALQLSLYDLRGRLLGQGSTGEGEFVLDHPLVSGIYIYRLKDTEAFKATGKLAVVGQLEKISFQMDVSEAQIKADADPVNILVQATGYEDQAESSVLADGNHFMTYDLNPETGTIIVDPTPNAIYAPWQLAGPNGYNESGNGDTLLRPMLVGSYTITWGQVFGWDSPLSSTRTLSANQTVVFTGIYTPGEP